MTELKRLSKIKRRTKIEDTAYITELELRIKELKLECKDYRKASEFAIKKNQKLQEALKEIKWIASDRRK